MKSLKKLLPVALIAIILIACSKSYVKDDTAALLQTSDWHLTTLMVTPAQHGVTDLYATLPPCLKDNFLKFKANGIFNSDEGPTKCAPMFAQRDTGTWSYNESSKLLNFSSPNWQNKKLLVTATTSNTVSGTDDRVENGVAYSYFITITKQ